MALLTGGLAYLAPQPAWATLAWATGGAVLVAFMLATGRALEAFS
ncbi:hypothetical protein ACF8FG_24155 [Pseudomonas sp. YQ_6]|nr:hypothetical protein [Pseudomonas sp. BEA3.1]MDW2779904.1 hypothetical protein [Pseudomonas sp. BEA3.1]